MGEAGQDRGGFAARIWQNLSIAQSYQRQLIVGKNAVSVVGSQAEVTALHDDFRFIPSKPTCAALPHVRWHEFLLDEVEFVKSR
jgi:hypothetical protein